jgi:CheY-like chemotaxis protein
VRIASLPPDAILTVILPEEGPNLAAKPAEPPGSLWWGNAVPAATSGDEGVPVVAPLVCRIVVVEDEASIRDAVAEVLTEEGYLVWTASNGLIGLQLVEQQRPDCVLFDLWMPVMDGWTFVQELRARGLVTKIVVMTAATDAEKAAEQLAADGYLAKPFDLNHLVALVGELCSRS